MHIIIHIIILTPLPCTYNVSKTNNYDLTSYDLHVCFTDGPSITNIVSLPEVLVNQTLTLKCEAHGDPLPSYTWQHNGKNISHNSVYIKSSVTTEDSGSYTCIATNRAAGILMSDSKTVEVMVISS